jgi:hypothetical protein
MKNKLFWMAVMSGRQKRTILFAGLCISCLIVGSAIGYFYRPPTNSSRFYLDNTGGAVLFDHGFHTKQVESCAECHHDLFMVDEMTMCTECHDEQMLAEEFTHQELIEIESHECSSCHTVNNERKEQSCRACHPQLQQETTTLVSCSECHDDEYTSELLTHDEMQELDGHSCDGCHHPQSLSDSYHRQCNSCHLRENAQLFSASDGQARCSACHLK